MSFPYNETIMYCIILLRKFKNNIITNKTTRLYIILLLFINEELIFPLLLLRKRIYLLCFNFCTIKNRSTSIHFAICQVALLYAKFSFESHDLAKTGWLIPRKFAL